MRRLLTLALVTAVVLTAVPGWASHEEEQVDWDNLPIIDQTTLVGDGWMVYEIRVTEPAHVQLATSVTSQGARVLGAGASAPGLTVMAITWSLDASERHIESRATGTLLSSSGTDAIPDGIRPWVGGYLTAGTHKLVGFGAGTGPVSMLFSLRADRAMEVLRKQTGSSAGLTTEFEPKDEVAVNQPTGIPWVPFLGSRAGSVGAGASVEGETDLTNAHELWGWFDTNATEASLAYAEPDGRMVDGGNMFMAYPTGQRSFYLDHVVDPLQPPLVWLFWADIPS